MLRIWHGTEGTPAERKHLAVRSMLEVYATTPSGGPIDEARGPANLQKLFDIYTSRYIEEPWRVLEAEIGFKIPLSDGLTIAGAIDAMIEWPSIGMLVREDKTTKGWLSEYYMKSWTRHFQPTFYVWALDQLRGDTVGCLMNCAQLVIPKKGPSENQFMRSPEMKTREELREFEHLIIEVHCRIIDDWKFWQDSEGAPNTWPKLGRFCFGGYGLRECTWASICKSTPQRRLGDISIDHYTFQETEWKPWDRKGED
uniref:Putative PD-(D/E)XK nuclease superfamily protein n=1 Tax=viral metagenome TaxID=1070528 RepID=A0A6M3LKI9_9ZZZZ